MGRLSRVAPSGSGEGAAPRPPPVPAEPEGARPGDGRRPEAHVRLAALVRDAEDEADLELIEEYLDAVRVAWHEGHLDADEVKIARELSESKRRAIQSRIRYQDGPEEDDPEAVVTATEWHGSGSEADQRRLAREAASMGLGVAALLRAMREVAATETSSAPPADVGAVA